MSKSTSQQRCTRNENLLGWFGWRARTEHWKPPGITCLLIFRSLKKNVKIDIQINSHWSSQYGDNYSICNIVFRIKRFYLRKRFFKQRTLVNKWDRDMTEMRPELHKWCFKSCVENLGCGTTYEFCTDLYLTQMNNHFLLRRGDDVDNKRKYCKN